MSGKLILILGGARSGKSSYAQDLAMNISGKVIYVATAEARDDEMKERIAVHKAERPNGWLTVEAPTKVGKALEKTISSADVVLLDCLTLLTSNILLSMPENASVAEVQAAMDVEIDELLSVIEQSGAKWIIVTNEVGLGLVPAYALGRTYRDVLGRVNQRLAKAADEVLFMVAGLPMKVK